MIGEPKLRPAIRILPPVPHQPLGGAASQSGDPRLMPRVAAAIEAAQPRGDERLMPSPPQGLQEQPRDMPVARRDRVAWRLQRRVERNPH
jgi:hypothetical protein